PPASRDAASVVTIVVPSLAFDGLDHPRVAWLSIWSGNVRFAASEDGWAAQWVTYPGAAPVLATTAAGDPWVLLPYSNSLRIASRSGGIWSSQEIAADGVEGTLRTAPSGDLAVAYRVAAGGLVYGVRDGAGWSFDTADGSGSAGYSPSLAFDAAGSP